MYLCNRLFVNGKAALNLVFDGVLPPGLEGVRVDFEAKDLGGVSLERAVWQQLGVAQRKEMRKMWCRNTRRRRSRGACRGASTRPGNAGRRP